MVTPFVCHFVKSHSHPSLYLDVLEVANCFVGLQKIRSKNEMLVKDQWFLYTNPWRFLSRGHGKITIVGIAIGLTMAPWSKTTHTKALTLKKFWRSNPKTPSFTKTPPRKEITHHNFPCSLQSLGICHQLMWGLKRLINDNFCLPKKKQERCRVVIGSATW